MSKDISFQLDTDAAADILQNMAMATVRQSTNAMAARAQSIAGSMSSDSPDISFSTSVGTIKRGRRAIGTIAIKGRDEHQMYVGRMALIKSKDAAKIN